jgi:hypothetical protein
MTMYVLCLNKLLYHIGQNEVNNLSNIVTDSYLQGISLLAVRLTIFQFATPFVQI